MTDENVPAEVPETETGLAAPIDLGEFAAGEGFENQTTADISIPFLAIVQDLSPQLDKDDEKYIEGAEKGSLFNTVSGELYPDGIIVVPVVTEEVFIEWVPQDLGGGFVQLYDRMDPMVLELTNNHRNVIGIKTANGNPDNRNDLVQTFQMYCLVIDTADATDSATPIVVSCTSSKIKPYRDLMNQTRCIKGNPPLFFNRIKITTRIETSKKNGKKYSNFVFEPATGGTLRENLMSASGPQLPLLREAKMLKEAIMGGEKKAAYDTAREGEGGDADDDTPF